MSDNVLSSTIEHVTVYRRGALVERVAALEPEAVGDVAVGWLPLSVVPGSLRVAVEPEAGADAPPVVATGVRLGVDVPGGEGPPDLAALRAARRDEARAQAIVQGLEVSVARLRTLPVPGRPEPREGEAPLAPPLDARLALLELRDAEVTALLEEVKDARAALRAATQAREDAEARAAEGSSDRTPRPDELRAHATVALQRSAPGAARLRLSYLVPGAAWVPAYALDLDGPLAHGRLALRAVVAQHTGEDWTGVALTVATALPQRWVDLPEPRALRIGRRRPAVAPSWRALPADTDTLFADLDAARPRTVPGRPRRRGGAARKRQGPAARAPRFDAPEAGAADTLAYDEPDDATADDDAVEPAMPMLAMPEYAAMPDAMEMSAPSPPPMPQAAAARPPAPTSARPGAARGKRAQPFPARAAESFAVMADEPAPAHGPARPAEELLDYGALQLPPVDGPGRGRLQPTRSWLPGAPQTVVAAAHSVAEGVPAAPSGRRPLGPAAFDHAWDADLPVDVPSDGRYHVVGLAAHEVGVAASHVAVPRLAPHVWQVVTATNPLDVPLPGGPVDVTVDGVHRLTADLEDTPPGAPVRLGLGVDEAVKVARHVTFTEENVGLVRGRRRLHTGIRIEVANRRSDPIHLEVRDRVPVAVPADDQVTVRDERSEPSWSPWSGEHDELAGGRRWTLDLSAAADTTLTASYTVDVASGHELAGGNRREP